MEPKKNPKIDAGRNSSLYFSLGLICALSLSFVVLQTEFKASEFAVCRYDPIEEPDFLFESPIEKEINIINSQVKKTQLITENINIVDDIVESDKNEPTPTIENVEPGVDDGVDQPQIVEARQIQTAIDKPDDTEVGFVFVEDVPIFPGCEKLPKDQHRACFEKKLKEHVMKNQRFPQQAQEIGLSGKVHAQFVIDENGYVKVANMRASHPMFEKEVQRVLNLLPKMTPGKQRLKPVKVSYILPFNFRID